METSAQEIGAQATAANLLAQGTENAAPLPSIDARYAAPLVMDYQPAWIQTLTDSDSLLSRAAQAIAMRDVVCTRLYPRRLHTGRLYRRTGTQHYLQPTGQPDWRTGRGFAATAVDDRVAPEPGDKVVRKTRVSAFARTDLDGWFRGLEIDTLILAGISTSGVVLSTVCDAADRDYRLIVLATPRCRTCSCPKSFHNGRRSSPWRNCRSCCGRRPDRKRITPSSQPSHEWSQLK